MSASYLSTFYLLSIPQKSILLPTHSLSSTSTSPLWLNSNLKRQVVAGIELAICSLLVNFPSVVAVASLPPLSLYPLLPLQLFCFPSISPNVYTVQQQLCMGIYRQTYLRCSSIPHREWVSLYSWMVSECERRRGGLSLKLSQDVTFYFQRSNFPPYC